MKQIYNTLHSWFETCVEDGAIKQTHWIWVDFFKDKEEGYKHFVAELTNDKDYAGIDFDMLTVDEAADISDEIRQKLSDSSFNNLVMLRQLGL